MQKRKMPRDTNSLAAQIVAMSTGQPVPGARETPPDITAKESSATKFARLGGLKGGKARAAALSKRKRAEIARIAAAARWERT